MLWVSFVYYMSISDHTVPYSLYFQLHMLDIKKPTHVAGDLPAYTALIDMYVVYGKISSSLSLRCIPCHCIRCTVRVTKHFTCPFCLTGRPFPLYFLSQLCPHPFNFRLISACVLSPFVRKNGRFAARLVPV